MSDKREEGCAFLLKVIIMTKLISRLFPKVISKQIEKAVSLPILGGETGERQDAIMLYLPWASIGRIGGDGCVFLPRSHHLCSWEEGHHRQLEKCMFFTDPICSLFFIASCEHKVLHLRALIMVMLYNYMDKGPIETVCEQESGVSLHSHQNQWCLGTVLPSQKITAAACKILLFLKWLKEGLLSMYMISGKNIWRKSIE